MQDDPLPQDEASRLAALPRAIDPPARLEERVVRELHDRGTLRGPSGRWPWLSIAAALVLMASGFALGRLTGADAGAPPAPGTRYLLLLYGGAAKPGEGPSRVAEYAAWARAEAADGRLINGEKLGSDAVVIGDASGLRSVNLREPSGYFVIRASTQDEAVATASRCPHLKHGGTVLIRPIE
jgi:hypothetical protein